MPNKRKEGKKLLGGFYDEKEVEAFKKRATEMGMTVKDLLGVLIRAELKKNQQKENDNGNA